MTVDVSPFEMNSAFVKLVFMSINNVGFEEDAEEKMKEDMALDAFESTEKPIYPKAREDSLDFLLKQRDANSNVTIYPRGSVVFNKTAAKAFEEKRKAEAEVERQRVEQEKKEVEKRLAEMEVEVMRLWRDIANKLLLTSGS